MDDSPWLVPFKGRNSSNAYNQNFLWKHDSIYIMDNHRAALWCWLQHFSNNETVHLFHIDQHYDTLTSNITDWVKASPNFRNLTVEEFLMTCYNVDDDGCVEIVRWDNYLSLFLALFPSCIKDKVFCTHCRENNNTPHCDLPNSDEYTEIGITELPCNLNHFLAEHSKQWIVNLDIDFFFSSAPKDEVEADGNSKGIVMLSDGYMRNVFQTIKKKYHDGNIRVITVALSPECCGGWENAESVCSLFCEVMGLDFKLLED